MQDFSIERVDKANLVFTGEVIGKSDDKARIAIYRTKGGKFVGAIKSETRRSKAGHFDEPLPLVNWLRTTLNGLTDEAQAAVGDAAKNDEKFKAFWTERVE